MKHDESARVNINDDNMTYGLVGLINQGNTCFLNAGR
jgi:ubiquitin C-terminal hydrolase